MPNLVSPNPKPKTGFKARSGVGLHLLWASVLGVQALSVGIGSLGACGSKRGLRAKDLFAREIDRIWLWVYCNKIPYIPYSIYCTSG